MGKTNQGLEQGEERSFNEARLGAIESGFPLFSTSLELTSSAPPPIAERWFILRLWCEGRAVLDFARTDIQRTTSDCGASRLIKLKVSSDKANVGSSQVRAKSSVSSSEVENSSSQIDN